MKLTSLSLQNFRSYKKSSFTFSSGVSIIIGPNTSGKSNIIEAVRLLSRGKSFRAEKDLQMIRTDQDMTRVTGSVINEQGEENTLEIVIAKGELLGKERAYVKRYFINNVPKTRMTFATTLKTLLFDPSDLDIIVASPGLRRNFLDDVLEQIDQAYLKATIAYMKALRQRNALLEIAKETGKRSDEHFAYWDELLIANGTYITEKREAFIAYINSEKKEFIECSVTYDKSIISKERLHQYYDAEKASGVTLVGPHRDDFFIEKAGENIKYFGSRGQQRLVILQLKMMQLFYMEKHLHTRPLLLLDDIFSELDTTHINLVLSLVRGQQTILTTTHKEFLNETDITDCHVIELKKV